MFVLPVHVRGHVGNPYIGILVFIMIPMIFFAGLGLIPLGIFLGRRRIKKGVAQAITDPKLALRRLAWFLGSATAAELDPGHAVHLPGRRAHGIGSVLRADLPRDDTRIFCLSKLAPFPFAVRGLPCGAGC